MDAHSSNNVCGHAEQALGSSKSQPCDPDPSALYKQWRQAKPWPRQKSVRTDPDEGDPAMLIELHIPKPSERFVLPWDDSFSSLWRPSKSTPPGGNLIKSWLDRPWLSFQSGNSYIGSNNPSPLPTFPTLLACLEWHQGISAFPINTLSYYRKKHFPVLILNHTGVHLT